MSEVTKQPKNEVQRLTSTKTTPQQNRVALLVGIALLCVCILAHPYAMDVGPRAPASFLVFIIPAIFAALMTAYLLFGQFLGTRLPSLAILGTTYLYVSMINIPYLLVSPAIGAHYIFSGSQDTIGWLWIFLQIGYLSGIFLYLVVNRWYNIKRISRLAAKRFLCLLLIITPLLAVFLFVLALDPLHMLPKIMGGDPTSPSYTPFIRVLIFSLNACMCLGALVFLRDGSVLHLWLRVSTLAALITVSFNLYSRGRYSIGWYTSRVNGLMAATLVLCALLYEVNKLYTRLAQQNEELAKQNRLQSDFLSIVGHEFRTALTGILGFSEVIRERELDDQDVQEYAADIHTDATRLINTMLDLERMKSGRMEMNWEAIEMNALIQEIVNHRPAASGEQIYVDLDTTLTSVQGDRDKLTQVLINLLSNASKYTLDGSPILIGSKREGDAVHSIGSN
jgi:signal transduction histidine kinase